MILKERKVPMRKCVGCMQSKEKQTLTRIALYEGQICVDPSGRAKGRGVYLCKNNPDCLEKADKRRALERAFSMTIAPEVKQEIFARIAELDDLEPASDDGSGKGQDA